MANTNKLVINPHGRNHFKYMPLNLDEWPTDEGEQIKKVEATYKELCKSGEVIYTKSKSGNYSIRCVKLGDMYYIVVCMKNEFKSYNNVIYEIKSQNDALAICKFIGKNIQTTMSDYKKQILDAWKYRKEAKNEKNTGTSDDKKEDGTKPES